MLVVMFINVSQRRERQPGSIEVSVEDEQLYIGRRLSAKAGDEAAYDSDVNALSFQGCGQRCCFDFGSDGCQHFHRLRIMRHRLPD